jgi:hypothetical protein
MNGWVSSLKARWNINQAQYNRIAHSMVETLQELGIYGERVQGMQTQVSVDKATENILGSPEHYAIISRINRDVAKEDLNHMAQNLSRNHRRQVRRKQRRRACMTATSTCQRHRSSSTESVDSNDTKIPRTTARTPLVKSRSSSPVNDDIPTTTTSSTSPLTLDISTLESKIVVVRWRDGDAARMYLLQDILFNPVSGDDDRDDARLQRRRPFTDFITILKDEFSFAPTHDLLSYESKCSGKVWVSSEIAWRAVSQEMRSQNQLHLNFTLHRGGNWSTIPKA